jgi:hypothetical protein
MRPVASDWKNRPKYGGDQATEMEIVLRVLREDRERTERARVPRIAAPKLKESGK